MDVVIEQLLAAGEAPQIDDIGGHDLLINFPINLVIVPDMRVMVKTVIVLPAFLAQRIRQIRYN